MCVAPGEVAREREERDRERERERQREKDRYRETNISGIVNGRGWWLRGTAKTGHDALTLWVSERERGGVRARVCVCV